jgi:prepilin-type N-terminal cleavage/methylation domain-containing protein
MLVSTHSWREKAFSIVELVIVIAVIGILSSLSLVAYSGNQEDARYAQAESEMRDIIQLTRLASANSGGKTLGQMLGYQFWTGAECYLQTRPSGDPILPLYELPEDHDCWVDYHETLDKLEELSRQPIPDSIRDGDPWGNPYYLDENEGADTEVSGPCTPDLWVSAGPNGYLFTDHTAEDDDIRIKSPYIALDYCPPPDLSTD